MQVQVAMQNLDEIKAKHKRAHKFTVLINLFKIIEQFKKNLNEELEKYRY